MTRYARGRGRRATAAGLLMTVTLLAGLLLTGHALPFSGARTATSATRGPTGARGMTALGPASPDRPLAITLVLRGRSSAELDRTLAGLSDPASPSYRHFLSPAEYARRFGPDPARRQRVEAALTAAGLRVTWRAPDGTLLRVQATIQQAEAFFGVRIEDFRGADGRRFYAATTAPTLPPALREIVTGVLGLESYSAAHPAALRSLPSAPRQAGQTVGFAPDDLARAYDFAPLRSAGLDGTGQTIAFAEIDTFRRADIATYDREFNISAPAIDVVDVGAGAARPDQVSETTLDIEVVHAVAPQAHLIAYEGGGDIASLAQIFRQIVSDHRAQVMSVSLGLCERFILDPSQAPSDLRDAFTVSGQGFFSSLDDTFRQAAAVGMSVLVATGDTGAYGCNQADPSNHEVVPSAPATSPFVTAVGGTALFPAADGAYGREYGWEGPLEGAGGGGGLSLQYALPSWQSGRGVANQFSDGRRQVPDVAADADPLTGYAIYDSTSGCRGQQCWGVVGGTSAAAPLWAGLIALANQAGAKQGLRSAGFLNPALYRLGNGAAGASGASPFHDITGGGNLFYPATPGWDYSTGWGSPDANALVPALLTLERGG